MNGLVAGILQLDDQRQAVFYVALAGQVQSVLVTSKDYEYAVRTVDLCWQWIESHDVDPMTLYNLYHADDDSGVETAMYISHEHNITEWNAWGCFCEALGYTGYCAFSYLGELPPETFENAFPDEYAAEFLGYYHAVVGPSGIPVLLVEWLKGASDDQLTRAVVWGKMQEFIAGLA